MKLDEIVIWYQKKIGTYDKQQWEKSVEQKILDGFTSVTLKTAKLKTELIDVDLVRGSTFPKAKPKQNLLTVIRLAILRYIFLPLYAQWWVRQTSPNIFALLLFLYLAQMINWGLYTLNIDQLESPGRCNRTIKLQNGTVFDPMSTIEEAQSDEHIVPLSTLLIPMTLSLLLSLIHSQIVATNSVSNGSKNKRRRYSSTSQSNTNKPREIRPRARRKKLVKNRSQDILDNVLCTSTTKRSISMAKTQATNGCDGLEIHTASTSATTLDRSLTKSVSQPTIAEETFHTTTAIKQIPSIAAKTVQPQISIINSSINLTIPPAKLIVDLINVPRDEFMATTSTDSQLGKRNVNWDSPIRNYAVETKEKQQQTSPQADTSSDSSTPQSNDDINKKVKATTTDSIKSSPNKSVRINNSVQEFCSEFDQQQIPNSTTLAPLSTTFPLSSPNYNHRRVRAIGEDDGFESLNGKSSSGEDTRSSLTISPNNSTAPSMVKTNQLRLRLNVTNEKKSQVRSTTERSSSEVTDEEGDDGDIISSPASVCNNDCTTSATEWLGITTNSDDCSYSSEMENTDDYKTNQVSDEDNYELDFTPTTILNPHSATDRISCTIWDQRDIKKAQMSVLEISSCIIERVDSMPDTNDYIYIGICFSVLLSFIPTFCRLCDVTIDADKSGDVSYFDLPMLLWEKASFSFFTIFRFAFGNSDWERVVLVIGFIQRFCLTLILFIIFTVAERTFKQRFLYAKLFSHLTSSRRARKSNLPHFRLNKVRNIKTWLSVRSYLKKRGPQRSVDIIVSAAFIVTLLLLAFLSVEWLKDSVHLHSQLNLEALMWSITIGIFLLRYMTLGNKIHHKYRSVSVLITEQINLYLQIEQKPKKKDELMVSNSVLKLAADLLKELETPFKISGLSANPYLFTTIKVVILSALSGVLSEILGFKLKLHKIKIK